jgi:hypothetical protein
MEEWNHGIMGDQLSVFSIVGIFLIPSNDNWYNMMRDIFSIQTSLPSSYG